MTSRYAVPDDPFECVRCGRNTQDDPDARYQVVMPRGLSSEQIRQAVEDVELLQRDSRDARAAHLVFYGFTGGDHDEDEEAQTVLGLALIRLGAYVVVQHADCSARYGLFGGEYSTDAWGDS